MMELRPEGLNIRIPQSGSEAQIKGDSRDHGM